MDNILNKLHVGCMAAVDQLERALIDNFIKLQPVYEKGRQKFLENKVLSNEEKDTLEAFATYGSAKILDLIVKKINV